MIRYRAYFMDHGNHIRGSADFEAADDERAMAYAHTIWGSSSIGSGYEIWADERLVSTTRRPG